MPFVRDDALGQVGPWTALLAMPAADMLLRREWLHRQRKTAVTLGSIVSTAAGSLWCCLWIVADARSVAAIGAVILWQVGYILDCLDGKIARRYGSGSAAGACVDALADVWSLSFVLVALLFAVGDASQSFTLVLAGAVVLKTTGPLWTVSSKFVLDPSAVDVGIDGPQRSEGKLREVYKIVEFGLVNAGDHGIFLALVGIIVVAPASLAATVVVAYVALVGAVTAILALGMLVWIYRGR